MKNITRKALDAAKSLFDDYELNIVPVVENGTCIAVVNAVYPSPDVVCYSVLKKLPVVGE